VIYYNEYFDTEAKARAFAQAIINAYHPCGYGTSMKVEALPDGRWFVSGYRYSSCD